MNREERNLMIRKFIFDFLSVGEPFCTADDLNPETHLQDDLGADSLDEIELVMEFEERFDVVVPDELAEQLKTVGDVYNLADRMKVCC